MNCSHLVQTCQRQCKVEIRALLLLARVLWNVTSAVRLMCSGDAKVVRDCVMTLAVVGFVISNPVPNASALAFSHMKILNYVRKLNGTI